MALDIGPSHGHLSEEQRLFIEELKSISSDDAYGIAQCALRALELELYDISLYISTLYSEKFDLSSDEEEAYQPLSVLFNGLKEAVAFHIRFQK